jgi:hypothetical protein
MRWNRRDPDGWHRWFAWHPVEVREEDICVETVWLEFIERRERQYVPPHLRRFANEHAPYEYRNILR